jgi:beta-galactosidase
MSVSQKIPEIGAQVWIEPGPKEEDYDHWFRIMAEHQMSCARVWLMWNYIETGPDVWDFSLYDQAFHAAVKYGVKIQATLTANHGPAHADESYWYHNQGETISSSRDQLTGAEKYIRQVVKHFKNHPALENWWLQNEPGQAPAHDELALERFRTWLKDKYQFIENLNEKWITHFSSFGQIVYDRSWDGLPGFYSPHPFHDWNIFWRDHLTWYMSWIADHIRKYDDIHPIHVNPHAVFDILPKYDLPAWRHFLGSLGASIHPSWHFRILERDRYAMGVSAVCQIIKGAIEPKPFWISELQGGNNIFSALQPLYPEPRDLGQWIWTGIGSGAEKIIFWCLNARRTGSEAGEWSLLDYQGNPSERLEEVKKVTAVIRSKKEFFLHARPVPSDVTIVLSPETMLAEARQDRFRDIPGRSANAHVLSSLAFFETLSELGIPADIKQVDDFDWDDPKTKNHVAVLANMTCIPQKLVPRLEAFVQNKNKLIITGLTGYFDESENNWLLSGFPLEKLVGGTIKEIRLMDQIFYYRLNGIRNRLPVHMWESEIIATTGKAEGKSGERIIALRNFPGEGEVLWIPAMVGLGAWLSDNRPLAELLDKEIKESDKHPFSFAGHYPGVFMKVLQNGNEFLMALMNGKNEETGIFLNNVDYQKLKLLYGRDPWFLDNHIHLEGRGTLVFHYSD